MANDIETVLSAARADTANNNSKSSTKKALIALRVLAALIIVGVFVAILALRASINSQIRHIPTTLPSRTITAQSAPATEESPATDAVTFLVLGSDSRTSGGDPTNWEYGAQRSDVLLLVQISADRTSMSMMSLPRDSWVEIPGHGKQKINAAYSLGGPDLTIATVESLTGVHIDHFIVTDFTGFAKITDELGGVSIHTSEGKMDMNGAEALDFVRERYSLPRGDFDRMRRQQAWMKAIMAKVFSRGVLTDPATLDSVLRVLLAHSAMDEGLNFDSLFVLATECRSLRPDSVTFFTVPTIGVSTSPDGQSIILLDENVVKEVGTAFTQDRVTRFLDETAGIETLDSRPLD